MNKVLTLTPTIQLLLLFSRMALSEQQRCRAEALSEQVDDWRDFARRAEDHFIAPLCLHHLKTLQGSAAIEAARAALLPVARAMTAYTLRVAAVQRSFIQRHLAPLGCPFAVVKGRALAARYYPDPNLRYARDLDILVPVAQLPALVKSAQADGYRGYPDSRRLSSGEAHVLGRQKRVLNLVGADNVLIEVHTHLDKAGFVLDHRAMLQRSQSVCIDGVDAGVLQTADCFVYICLHHTNHFWSRLSWVADLDALIGADDFDRDEVLSLARSRGLERTVQACLDFHQACADLDDPDQLADKPEARDLLRVCLATLADGVELEQWFSSQRHSLDFAFEWQVPAGFERRARWRRLVDALRPNDRDYHMLELPPSLYWLYYLLRPGFLIKRRMFG